MKKMLVALLFSLSVISVSATNIVLHFKASDNKAWNLWVWPEGGEGSVVKFTETDEFGLVAHIKFDKDIKKVGYIVRLDDWTKDFEEDRFIDVKDGSAQVWVISKDAKTYTTNPDKGGK